MSFWWVPVVCLIYGCYAYITKKNNDSEGVFWFWCLFGYGLVASGFWSIFSKFSKNILIDGFIYDFFVILSSVVTLIYLGSGENLNKIQWIGIVFVFVGIILMKIQLKES